MSNLSTDYVLADQVGFLLRRAHQRASLIFKKVFDEQALTPQQFAVLAKLYEVNDVTQNKLGRLVDMDPSSLQGVIQRLTQRGFVSRKPDPQHKRRLTVHLTATGGEMLESCLKLGRQVSQKTLHPLNRSEQSELLRLLKIISEQ
ncbi:MAG: winged helix-turn-helix transcriptional regulator [Gammaproteobacteria bacterium]|nr:winged helix-turn-helix transcriptional regulator [Gammaproteobacteria bacterium]